MPRKSSGWREASEVASANRWARATPKRWRALWVPDTLPVSSFTHSSTDGSKPTALASSGRGAKGVTSNPRPSTAATASSTASMASISSASVIAPRSTSRWASRRRA